MADAKITISLTPAEFDLIRTVLDEEFQNSFATVHDRHTDLKLKNAARTRSAQLKDILDKLK